MKYSIDCKDKLYNHKDKLKQNMIVLEENIYKYITPTGVVYLTSTLPLLSSKHDLYAYYPTIFQKSRSIQNFT